MEFEVGVTEAHKKKPGSRRHLVVLLKIAVLATVFWFIWWAIDEARAELRDRQFSMRQVDLAWMSLACAFYVAGMLPMWWFWRRTLRALGQRPGILGSLRAFFIGHLGKYVPGKAMVVVLRTSFIRSAHVDATIAALSVFVETLTMMAVGAFLAGAIFAFQFAEEIYFQLLAWGLMAATGIPILPPIFRRIVAFLQVSRLKEDVNISLQGLTFRLMFFGWLACAAGWCLMGASLWATLKSVPLGPPVSSFWDTAPRLIASVAMAVVAGFLSLIPGGLGVRDIILDRFIVSEFGAAKAIVATVLLRLAWLVTEVVVSIILYVGALRHPSD